MGSVGVLRARAAEVTNKPLGTSVTSRTYTGIMTCSRSPVRYRSSMQRMAVMITVLFMANWCMAQNKFTVNGRMKVEAGDMSNARVVVYKNGVKERTLTNTLTKFSLDLELNSNYIVSFEKDGYVSKKISFNTKVPSDVANDPFTPFDFAVSIFKQYDETNMVVFNQPVGLIRFEPGLGDFDYDTDYTRSIQAQLQAAQEEVEQKQKAEVQVEAANAKAKAKADADAKRAGEQAARARMTRPSPRRTPSAGPRRSTTHPCPSAPRLWKRKPLVLDRVLAWEDVGTAKSQNPLSRSIFWGPMAVAIMGGLVVATVLTLLALPAMYAAWFRVKREPGTA